eukprot:COSAG01_NODE_4044_length_5408_cov_1.746468_6_plen_64_part_00
MTPSIIHAQCQSLRTHNVRDHRARTSDHPFLSHAQVGLRVHRIVILPLAEVGVHFSQDWVYDS